MTIRNMDTSPIGALIRRRLAELGKNQSWLARECKVTPTAVTLWLKSGKVGKDNVSDVARKLEIDEELLTGPSQTEDSMVVVLTYVTAKELQILTAWREATRRNETYEVEGFERLLKTYQKWLSESQVDVTEKPQIIKGGPVKRATPKQSPKSSHSRVNTEVERL